MKMPVSKIKDKRLKIKDNVKKPNSTNTGSPLAKKARASSARKTTKAAGFSLPVFDLMGKRKGNVELPKEIFGAKENKVLMAQAVRVHLASQRQGTASTKTRGQVTGSTRKIYRQKGTGRARHGSIKAPIFVGGGIVFGPTPRNFSLKLSKAMRKKALFSALASKFRDEKVSIVDPSAASGKTKEIYGMFKSLSLIGKDKKGDKILFVSTKTPGVKRAVRNIQGIVCEPANSINAYDVLKSKHLVIVKEAIADLEHTFLGGKS